jgi:hypothetical protein
MFAPTGATSRPAALAYRIQAASKLMLLPKENNL